MSFTHSCANSHSRSERVVIDPFTPPLPAPKKCIQCVVVQEKQEYQSIDERTSERAISAMDFLKDLSIDSIRNLAEDA